MKRYQRLIAAAAAIALAAGIAAYLLRDRDAAEIRRRFDQLAADVQKRGPEGLWEAQSRARAIAAVFVERPRFSVAPVADGERPRAELPGLIFQLRASLDSLEIRVRSRELEIAPDRRRAVLRASAEIAARGAGFEERSVRAASIEWERTDDGWRIAAVDSGSPLRQLPLP